MRFNKETEDELRFLNSLGSNSLKGQEGQVTPKQLLRGYLEGCRKRTDWDKIDRHVAVQKAHEALLACQ